MSESKKSRAAVLAEQYGKKLNELQSLNKKVIHVVSDTTSPEQEEKHKKAIAKLRTFLD